MSTLKKKIYAIGNFLQDKQKYERYLIHILCNKTRLYWPFVLGFIHNKTLPCTNRTYLTLHVRIENI